MERNGYPVAAMVLGIVMGTMVEQSFVTSLIKSDGSILPFFSRPGRGGAGRHDHRRPAVAGGRVGTKPHACTVDLEPPVLPDRDITGRAAAFTRPCFNRE